MKLADQINISLQHFARGNGREIIIPNYFYGSYEMDLFRLTASGMIIEYEIKISRSDFKADFKKSVRLYTGGVEGNWRDEKNYTTITKHQALRKGEGSNRFYFVVPEDVIHPNDCPEYAGLIYATPSKGLYLTLREVKSAKLIHKIKAWEKRPNIHREIAEGLSFRELRLREKLRYMYRVNKNS